MTGHALPGKLGLWVVASGAADAGGVAAVTSLVNLQQIEYSAGKAGAC